MEDIAERYQDLVCNYTKVTYVQITSGVRKKEICEARQLLMYILSTYGKLTLVMAGYYAGNKHYSTVISSKKRVINDFETSSTYRKKYSSLLMSAKLLAQDIEAERRGIRIIKKGDLCWFWNDNESNPVLGEFLEIDKAGKLAYAENIFSPFRHWQYVDNKKISDQFRIQKMKHFATQTQRAL